MMSFLGINVAVPEDSWDPGKSYKLEFKGKDESYGKPPEGSLTEARAKKACHHINQELATLLSVIRGIGKRDNSTGQISVTFGSLFRYYIPISDKVVGLLLRARRWRLVNFSGEMLYQGQDDNTMVTLLISDDDIPCSRRFDFSSNESEKPASCESAKPSLQYISSDASDEDENENLLTNTLKSPESIELLPDKDTDNLLLSR